VVEAMRAGGYNLGGEPSGHIIFLDENTTGDGLITALQALAIMRRSGQCLSELTADFERFPQVLVNVQVAEKKPIESLPGVTEVVRRVDAELNGRGRVLIRYSGTEPKARVMVEGDDEQRVVEFANDIADELKRSLAGG
jgi:phosphoglucosamine mutase